jgi:hypothetical protein
MINWEEFNNMFQYYGNDIVIEIINMFEEEYDERFDALKKSIDKLDFREIQNNRRYIKGLLVNFCDPVPVEASYRLKEIVNAETSVGLTQEFDKLKIAADKLLIELREYRKTLIA